MSRYLWILECTVNGALTGAAIGLAASVAHALAERLFPTKKPKREKCRIVVYGPEAEYYRSADLSVEGTGQLLLAIEKGNFQ